MFAILFEVLLIEIQEEIHHFAEWEGGGLMGAKIVNKNIVNKLALPILLFLELRPRLPGTRPEFLEIQQFGPCTRQSGSQV